MENKVCSEIYQTLRINCFGRTNRMEVTRMSKQCLVVGYVVQKEKKYLGTTG